MSKNRFRLLYNSRLIIHAGLFMFEVSNKFHPFFICCTLFLSTPAQSVEIVRVIFNYESTDHIVDIELFDDITPLTVANYLSYVNTIDADGLPSFQDTFITRSETDFVLQTGGATFRPADPNVNALLEDSVPTVGLNAVVSQAPVNNEFNLSNLRGTIAMARPGGQPDGATKEWFINLSDNNTFLDGVDGGFTVFGQIIDDGMQTIDEIAALPIKIKSDELLTAILSGIFYKLPIATSYVDTDPITTPLLRKDIVMIDSITQINRPILNLSSSSINFPDDIVNDTVKQSITLTLTNSGNQDLIINPLNALSAPFNIDSDNCSSTTLQPVSSSPTSNCTIIFSLETTTVNTFTEDLVINYDSTPGNIAYSVTLNLQGTGVPFSPPELTVSDNALNFGDVIFNSNGNTQVLSIQNSGATPLSFNAFTIAGIDDDHFSISANSCDLNSVLFANATCTTTIQLDPLTPGSKNAELNISSDGGDISTALTGNVVIPVLTVETSFSITAQIGSPNGKSLIVTNTGDAGLIINSLSFSGADSTLFTQENNCPGVDTTGFASASLSSDETCIIRIRFSQTSDSEKTATLTLTSNAPDQASIEINISGTGGTDNDGVSDSIEANAPNNGDNNNDGIADNQQNNVASLLSSDNGYISFISDDSLPLNFPTSLEDVALIEQIAEGAPQSTNFNVGVYRYSVLVFGGEAVTVGVLLPAGKSPNAYFKFGPTPDNTAPHWYDFTFDVATQTGAIFLGEVDVLSSTGAEIRRNLVLISYIDGQRGDDDLLVNGIILNNQSGPSFPVASSSSGSIYLFPLISFFIICLLRQRKPCWSMHFNRVSQRFY